jgi:predicted kinase
MTTWVLFAGLPGTGKSTLAKALAPRLHAAILDKDCVRAALFPGSLTDYSAAQDQVCLRAMLDAAAYLTSHNRVPYIFFDGRTFSTQAQREEVQHAAERAGAPWRILHITCADAVAEARLGADQAHPAQNRTPALYRTLQHQFEPIRQPKLEIDTTEGMDGALTAAEAYLRLKE